MAKFGCLMVHVNWPSRGLAWPTPAVDFVDCVELNSAMPTAIVAALVDGTVVDTPIL